MYYAEKWIDGELFYKNTPKGKWEPFTSKMYARRVIEREEEIMNLLFKNLTNGTNK